MQFLWSTAYLEDVKQGKRNSLYSMFHRTGKQHIQEIWIIRQSAAELVKT